MSTHFSHNLVLYTLTPKQTPWSNDSLRLLSTIQQEYNSDLLFLRNLQRQTFCPEWHKRNAHHVHQAYLLTLAVDSIFLLLSTSWCNYQTQLINSSCMQCAAIKKTPLDKYHYFQYISIFFYEIFRGYSGHNLPLLLRILSSQLLLFWSSTSLNIKDDFSTAQTNKSDYNQLSGVL